jgi:hypothetical protein
MTEAPAAAPIIENNLRRLIDPDSCMSGVSNLASPKGSSKPYMASTRLANALRSL